MNQTPVITATKMNEFLISFCDIYADHLHRRGSTFIMRCTFFYTHGKTAEFFANKLRKAGLIVLNTDEVWNPWPKDSYWEVQFELPPNKTTYDLM